MQFRVLSGVTAHREEELVHLGDMKQRLFLAILLLAESRPVTQEDLIDKIWGDEPIVSARGSIHLYASELRRQLGKTAAGDGDTLPKYEGGYRVLAGRNQVDVHRFRDLVKEARPLIRHDDPKAVRVLRKALAEWGHGLRAGEPLSNVGGQWVEYQRVTLREEHRATLIACLEAELRLGRHTQLIPELLELSSTGAPDEQVTGLLMRAYYRAGRSAAALAAFKDLRQRLALEIGADPGADIEHLHQRILQQDPNLHLPSASSPCAAAPGTEVRSPGEVGRNATRLMAEVAVRGDTGKIGFAWSSASARILERVRTRFRGDPAAEGALAQVELAPADLAAVTALEHVLILHLSRDLAFLNELSRLVDQAQRAEEAYGGPSIVANTIKAASVYHAPVHIAGDFNIS